MFARVPFHFYSQDLPFSSPLGIYYLPWLPSLSCSSSRFAPAVPDRLRRLGSVSLAIVRAARGKNLGRDSCWRFRRSNNAEFAGTPGRNIRSPAPQPADLRLDLQSASESPGRANEPCRLGPHRGCTYPAPTRPTLIYGDHHAHNYRSPRPKPLIEPRLGQLLARSGPIREQT